MKLPANRKEYSAMLFAGAFVWIALLFVLGAVLDFGGGSFVRGFQFGFGWLILYGLPILILACLLGAGVCFVGRCIGVRTTGVLLVAGGLMLVVITAVTSSPHAKLTDLAQAPTLPRLRYIDYKMMPTFSDGTAHLWTANCPGEKLDAFVSALKLGEFTGRRETGSTIASLDYRVGAYLNRFEGKPVADRFFVGNGNLVAGYHSESQTVRVALLPYF